MQNLQALDWQEILRKINSFATSESAKQKLLLLQPLSSEQEALDSMQEILDAGFLLGQGVRPFAQSLDLFSMWFSRLKKNAVLKNLEIKDVRSFCLEVVALREALTTVNNDWAKRTYQALMEAGEPLSAIDQILTPQGDIRSDASEKLFRLFSEKEKLAREVQSSLDRLVKDHQVENMLQDKYVTTREGRWVLPVKSGMQHFMPGVIHGSSQTKQTVFMEPEKIIPFNNRLRQIEVEIEDEIERLLTELSHYLASKINEFESSRDQLEQCDLRLAEAQFCAMIKASVCNFSEDTLELVDVRHPILALGQKEVIPNSVHLDRKKSILLLSGPNAGGKTVLLKSIGLAAQMARCGLPICADERSKIPFFKNLLIGIGDAQSVGAELSTFAAHLHVLNQALHLKGSESLILIDEICGSTDPEEGSALARSFIEGFAQNHVFGIITSHLSPLKSGWKETDAVINGSLEYNTKTGRPTYHFISGIPGDSLALQTAKRVGVNAEIIEKAVDFLSPDTRRRLQSLEQIEKLKEGITQLQDELRRENQKAQALKKKYEKMIEDFEKEKSQSLQKSLRHAEKKVEEAIQQARVSETFQRHRNLQEIKYQLPEIVKAKSITVSTAIESADDFAKKFPPGSKVYVPSLSQDAIVQSTPNAKGEVLILSNSIRLQVAWQDLKPPEKSQNPTTQLVRKSSSFSMALNEDDKTIDLRGKTVEEAIEDLEIQLDHAAQSHRDRLKIIHGHGTEALKKAVRTYLSRSIYVKKWKSGPPEGGGDGVTWVELNDD